MNLADTHPAIRERRRAFEAVPAEKSIVITIDGPAGTGKSTVARQLAGRLGIDFLDTGAMYRAATAIMLDDGIDPGDHGAIVARVTDADLHFDWSTDPPAMLAWGEPLDHRIRDPDVTASVSGVSTIGALRRHMVRKQQIIAHQHPRLVTEGRDQGSVVFPEADVKFYLDAKPEVRAQRRAEQHRAAGREVDERSLLAQILERDRIDSTRADGPLTCPEDAIVIDTSDLDIDGVVSVMERAVLARVGALRNAGEGRAS